MRTKTKWISLSTLSSSLISIFALTITYPSFGASPPSNLDRAIYRAPTETPFPADNMPTEERVFLGRVLFFDPRLSGSASQSCASCHNPALGWSDGLPVGQAANGSGTSRATPGLTNSAFQQSYYWDGRARSLEEQVYAAFKSPLEMNQKITTVVKFVKSNKRYIELFERAFPGEAIDKIHVVNAIASFERSLVSFNTPFDRWIAGESEAMSQEAVNGFNLFKNKARCTICHSGVNFSDDHFHNVGLKKNTDEGRGRIEKNAELKFAFRTPSLRDVARTAPYMHNGNYSTLEQVIDHYNRGGDGKKKDPNLKKLNLSKQEKIELASFLRALTSDDRPFEIPMLPIK